MTLRAKLLAAQAPLAAILVVFAWASTAALARLGASPDLILKDNYRSVLAAERMMESLDRLQAVALRLATARPVDADARAEARPLHATKDPVDDLALNQATEKGNVRRRVQQVHEPAACTEEFHRGLTGRHARTVRRRLSHLNLLPAEKFPDDRHL